MPIVPARPAAHKRPVYFWVDGGMLGPRNPSPEGVFWSVYRRLPSGAERIVIAREQSKDYTTNNEAEWLAVRAALRFAFKYHVNMNIHIFSDSELVVNQYIGRYQCKQPRLQVLARECWALQREFPDCVLSWCPRREMVRRLGH